MNSSRHYAPLRAAMFALAVLGTGYIAPVALGPLNAAQAATPSKLGDLTAFRTVAADVASLVDRGDLSAAKKRIRDLELSWDSAEAGIKPRDAADWHVIDKAIDRALGALRADAPKADTCKQATTELLQIMDRVGGK